jgi:hypothetical protein
MSSGIISFSLPFHLFGDRHLVKGSLDSGESPIATDRQGDDSEGILVPEVDCKELLSIAPSDEDGVASSWTVSSGVSCESAGGGIGIGVSRAIGDSSVIEGLMWGRS